MHDQFFRCILNGTGDRGVVPNWRNELAVTAGSGSVSIATGAAVVYGMFYDSDSALSFGIPVPSTDNSRYDRIVVRRIWADQTVRVVRVSGTAAFIPSIPALTQTVDIQWEIPLATVLIDDEANITLTDDREWITMPTAWPANIVDTGMYEEGAVTAAKIPDRTRYELKGAGQIEPNSANPCVWTVGGSYDYWQFADAAFNRGWVYFMSPTGVTSSQVDIYVWSVPTVNGAGAGVENCQWDYSVYYGDSGGALTNAAASVNVDQQARVNTTVYRDQLINNLPAGEGQIIALRLSRDGAADSYNSAMALLGIEMSWTADA
jgi:hypothetical protein